MKVYRSRVIASKYLEYHKPKVFHLVSLKIIDGAVPEIRTIHSLAIETDYHLGKSSQSQLNA
jgi:hypothetical protein